MVDGELVRGYTYWLLSMNQRTSFHSYTIIPICINQYLMDGIGIFLIAHIGMMRTHVKKNLVATRNSNSQSLKQSNQWFRIEQ